MFPVQAANLGGRDGCCHSYRYRNRDNLRAKKPSSSSLLVGAGSGAPGPSFEVGSLT